MDIQYTHRMGFRTIVLSHDSDNETLARKLGADEHIDYNKRDRTSVFQRPDGVRVIYATASNSHLGTVLFDRLLCRGWMIVIGVNSAPIEGSPMQLIGTRHSPSGWASGHARNS